MNFKKILKDIKNGIPIVVYEEHRESEGDIVLSAETLNAKSLLFAMIKCGGLMCLPATTEIVENQFKLPMMVEKSNDYLQTPFSLLVDSVNCKTGMSLQDRLLTIKTFVDPMSKPEDLRKPGHLAVLKARKRLLLDRKGHTESSIVLMQETGVRPVSVIVEIMDFKTGEMAKGKVLKDYCKKHNLKMITVEDIVSEVYGNKYV